MTPERIAELRRFGVQEYKADPIESSWTAMLDEIERLQKAESILLALNDHLNSSLAKAIGVRNDA